MLTYAEIDIMVSPSGDMMLAANRDFALAAPSGTLQQDIVFRVRTDYNDFRPHPDIGANLTELIGEPNTRALAANGEDKILSCLTRDGRVRDSDLVVKAVPIALDKIVYYLFVRNGTTILNVTPDYLFDINAGIISY